MGDASAACYDDVNAGLGALLLSGAPLAEKRDGLAFEDQLVETMGARLHGTLDIANVEGGDGRCHGAGHSASVNGLHGLSAPDKHRGTGRPTNSRDRAPYKGLSKPTRFCSICQREDHKRTT